MATTQKSEERLVQLYQELADHTRPECEGCLRPYSCCEAIHCEGAIRHAKKRWGIELERTDHQSLPLMGPTGCTAPPHTRPVCVLHTCQINSLGFKPDDPEWTERYFELRDEIDKLEWDALEGDIWARNPGIAQMEAAVLATADEE